MILTELEAAVLSLMVETYPAQRTELAAQLKTARLLNRELTGHGFFLNFEASGPPISPPDCELTDIHADLAGESLPVGFILFVRDGRVRMLEGFTYGGPWPESEKIERVYAAQVNRVRQQ